MNERKEVEIGNIFFMFCPFASLIDIGHLFLGVAVALNLCRCLAVGAGPAAERGHGVAGRGALDAVLPPGHPPKEKGWRRNEKSIN